MLLYDHLLTLPEEVEHFPEYCALDANPLLQVQTVWKKKKTFRTLFSRHLRSTEWPSNP